MGREPTKEEAKRLIALIKARDRDAFLAFYKKGEEQGEYLYLGRVASKISEADNEWLKEVLGIDNSEIFPPYDD